MVYIESGEETNSFILWILKIVLIFISIGEHFANFFSSCVLFSV